jgi:Replication-relaxation
MSRPERRRGRGAAGLTELAGLLSERDQAVLQGIAEHRYFTTRQVEQLLFANHSTPDSGARCCRRVLSRLERWGLLERPIRRVGGLQAGSASSIWMLSSAGQRLRNLQAGRGAVGRVREPGERFIQHYLAIGDAHLALVSAARIGRLELLTVQIEPQCWRSYTGLGGQREVLKPDLFAVTASGEFEDHWFIEIDRATESLPVLIRQCQQYESYRRSGIEQASTGLFPRVLWVVPDNNRVAQLRAALAGARTFDRDLFQVTTPDELIDHMTGGAP